MTHTHTMTILSGLPVTSFQIKHMGQNLPFVHSRQLEGGINPRSGQFKQEMGGNMRQGVVGGLLPAGHTTARISKKSCLLGMSK